jgi:hypothetical protein
VDINKVVCIRLYKAQCNDHVNPAFLNYVILFLKVACSNDPFYKLQTMDTYIYYLQNIYVYVGSFVILHHLCFQLTV